MRVLARLIDLLERHLGLMPIRETLGWNFVLKVTAEGFPLEDGEGSNKPVRRTKAACFEHIPHHAVVVIFSRRKAFVVSTSAPTRQ